MENTIEKTEEPTTDKKRSLQDDFLSRCKESNVPVDVFLVSGIRLKGQIDSFDAYSVCLKNGVTQLIYKHQISTVLPGRQV